MWSEDKKTENPEITVVLPRLLSIAEDAGRALETAEPALVERNLERCVTNLGTLQGQLLGLGLKGEQITRWQPVFTVWIAFSPYPYALNLLHPPEPC